MSDKEKEVIFKISKMLDLDEVEALVLWRQFWEVHRPAVPDHLEGYDDEVLERVTDFYFAERQSVMVVFGHLMTACEF